MLGYEPGELPHTIEGWKTLVHPDDLAANEHAIREHCAQRTPLYEHELRMRAKTGEWKWILDRGKVVRRAADGRPLRMAGTHSDVTNRRLLENRLRRVEELSEQVSRLALIGGWEYDLPTAQFTWSDGVRRIHEVDEAFALTIDSALSFYTIEAQDTIRAAMAEARLHGAPIDLELPLTTARGRLIWVRVLGKAEMQNGRAVRLHGAMQDITLQHESEGTRRSLELQLFQAQKMETLGTLAGGIAHDFNNLLTGIIGYHELAADSLPTDSPARAALTEARNASLRARELVEQILTFGRQSAGVDYGPLDLGVVLEEARRFLRATLPAKIAIELEFTPDASHVLGDATQLHQVLLNLGSNAAHAMRQQGGALKISVAPVDGDAAPDEALASLPPGSYIRLTVSDTGHGMDEATRRRIFDPFFTTKNTREGTGLGLAVVHGIVRSHRGAIAVASTPGAGTTFTLYLPAATPADDDFNPGLTRAPAGTGELICIVDDEQVVGNCTKLVLENHGYQTLVFSSAEACLSELAAAPRSAALLITDQTMPGMQGTELIATLRRLRPALPVVLMSGYFSKIPPEILDELGAIELLAKPFTTEELTLAVHRALHATA
jgi:PAS domain S-box-containing protein